MLFNLTFYGLNVYLLFRWVLCHHGMARSRTANVDIHQTKKRSYSLSIGREKAGRQPLTAKPSRVTTRYRSVNLWQPLGFGCALTWPSPPSKTYRLGGVRLTVLIATAKQSNFEVFARCYKHKTLVLNTLLLRRIGTMKNTEIFSYVRKKSKTAGKYCS